MFRQRLFVVAFAVASCLVVLPALSAEYETFLATPGPGGKVIVTRVETDNPQKYFKSVTSDEILVKALLKQTYNETGWDFLEITTNDAFSDEEQAYAAGYTEGRTTHDAIYKHWFNSLGDYCDGKAELCSKIDDFVERNMAWVEHMIQQKSGTSDYWHQVKLYYKQIEGLADGYKSVESNEHPSLSAKNILMLNIPDLDDIATMLKAKEHNFEYDDHENDPKVLGLLRCSALVKVLPDGSEMFSAQDTWSEFGSMLRFQKKYNFGYHKVSDPDQIVPGHAMTFSSYPGVITSGDDFYVISSGLVAMETTIGNSNASLWKNVKPEDQVSEGARSMVANRLSQTGREWSKYFVKYNSGTYNNQWMIVDYKKFKRGTKPSVLPDELLWVIEQIPGFVHAEDVTSVLRKDGYWPSYNVAYFKDIFNMSGNLPLVERYGDWFTYEKTPRALIFKRDQGTVTNLKTMLRLMRYNDFKNDPLSKCNCTPPYSGENAIAARCDLNPADGKYEFAALGHRSHGATDAKITSLGLFVNGLQFLAVSGPPYNETRGIPPFQWSKADFANKTRHLGHPDLWTFKPLIHVWT